MFKKSRIAILLRNNKFIYSSYLRFKLLFSKKNYKDLKYFLFFIGYPRSGSSTLGSIVDAHPNCIISHELNVLSYVEKGFSSKRLYYLIEKNSRLYTKNGRVSSGYSGIISGQLHSTANKLLIIGDKKAGKTTELISNNFDLVSKLQQAVHLPLKCIHIVRNPFDMITSQAYGGNEKMHTLTPELIKSATEFCFRKINAIQRFLDSGELDILTLKHEQLISNPEKELKKLFKWIEINPSSDYLKACSNHLYKNPHKSRQRYNWNKEEILLVQKKIEEVSFLRDYNFNN